MRGFSVASLRTDLESLRELMHLLIVISGAGAKPRHSHLPPEGRVVLSPQLTATKNYASSVVRTHARDTAGSPRSTSLSS